MFSAASRCTYTRTAPIFLLSAVSLLLAGAQSARAHDPGLSSAFVQVTPGGIEAVIELTEADFDTLVSAGESARHDFSASLKLAVDGVPLEPSSVRRPTADTRHSSVSMRFPPARGERLRVTSGLLDRLPLGHRQIVRVAGSGSDVQTVVLSAAAPAFEAAFPSGAAAAARDGLRDLGGAAAFFTLGIRHIATGYDHLLFLFALLVACRGGGAVARLVTAFTVAHSITLAGGTLGLASAPPELVEPLIAASIVAVAACNLSAAWRGERARERVGLTFGFGLLHGLGFAGLLADLDLSRLGWEAFAPLAAFNLGIEAGQLAIGAPIVALLALLRRSARLDRLALVSGSGVAGALGSFWLVERVLLA